MVPRVQVAVPVRLAARNRPRASRTSSNSNFAKARALLQEAGYDGTPVVIMQSTDIVSLSNLAPVAKSLLEKAGFKVDVQAMDWQTLVSRRTKKDPPSAGGWHAFLTSWASVDILDPVAASLPQRKLRQGDVRLAVRRRDREAARRVRQGDRSGQAEGDRRGRAVARESNTRRTSSSASTSQPVAFRKGVTGILAAPSIAFWNVEVK